jgi:uncharacterized membrane protein
MPASVQFKLMLLDILLDRAFTALAEAKKVKAMTDEQAKVYIETVLDPERRAEVAKALGESI